LNRNIGAPSWGALLKAIVIAVVIASIFDVAIHFVRTPLGWTYVMAAGLFVLDVILGFVAAAMVGVLVAIPMARLFSQVGYFRAAIAASIGALLGALTSILASAVGNSYRFMSGAGFWQGFAVSVVTGSLTGYLWWIFARRDMNKARA
jgi:hypothetical protein